MFENKFLRVISEIISIVFILYTLWIADHSKLAAKLGAPFIFQKNEFSFLVCLVLFVVLITLIVISLPKKNKPGKTDLVEEIVGFGVLWIMYLLLARTDVAFSSVLIYAIVPLCTLIVGVYIFIKNM